MAYQGGCWQLIISFPLIVLVISNSNTIGAIVLVIIKSNTICDSNRPDIVDEELKRAWSEL